mmetsp:Transcript_18918/g.38423  ORF Transcript_18918/g.38423 Transcript_18918/m.38423 type:complete len:274 (+) Transcript_18918:1192-2013(+)
MSGLSIWIWRSKRPGRSSAGSKMSARLVPASTTMPVSGLKPSISTSSWFRVFSRSSLPPENPPRPLARPTASISSTNTMHGACARAWLKRSRTREAPTPTNISMKSDPLIERKGTFASPAMALAIRVLPVPGGPHSSAPFGIFAPRLRNLSGLRRNSTNSSTSTLASESPATSLNVTLSLWSPLMIVGFAFPTLKMLPGPPPAPGPPMPLDICRMTKIQKPMMSSVGPNLSSSWAQDASLAYKTGTKSLLSRPRSYWTCSSLRSNASTLPMVK